MLQPLWLSTLGLLLACSATFGLPLRAAAVEWQSYLEDDFESPESMFYTGQAGEADYSIDDEGHYIVDGLDSGSDSLSALTDSLYYYYVQSDCQVLESTAGDLAFCGLVFHYHKLGDGRLAYYVFYTYGDGYYGAKRVIGTDVEILLPLKKTDLFNPDGYANTLAVDAQGTRFNLYINGDYVDGFTDMQVDGGGFGFYVSKNSRGAFDNFKVKTEKRGGSKREADEPSVADDAAEAEDEGPGRPARGYFGGYEPPEIPKDPDRPLYPWEVGYDKSYKKKIKQLNDGGAEDEGAPAADEDSPNGGTAAEPDEQEGEDSDYLPGGPVQAVPDEEVEDEPLDTEPRRSSRPEKKNNGAEGEDKPRSARATQADGRELPGDAEGAEEAGAGRRKAKGGKLQPTDGFREVGGPALPAAEQKESERQVRPPLKGDKAPFSDEPAEAADQAELPAEEGAAADLADEPVIEEEPLSEPQSLEESGGEMLRPDPAAADQAGDAESGHAAAGEDASAVEDAEPADQTTEQAEDERSLELKPELPGKGKPKGKGRKARAEKNRKNKSDSASEAKGDADASSADAPKSSRRRQGLKTGGDDWDSTSPVRSSKAGKDSKDKAKTEPDVEPQSAVPAEQPAAESDAEQVRPPVDGAAGAEAHAAPGPPEAAADGGSEGDAEPAAGPEDENLPEDGAPQDGFPGQQTDLGLPLDETGAAEPGADSMTESQDEAQPDAGMHEELAGATSQARPPARELPGDQPEVEEGGALSGSLLLDYVNVSTVQDDFSQPRWPVADNGSSSYQYFDGAYELNNLGAETMAISYQQDSFVDSEISIDASFIEGESAVGYGLAGRFRVEDGAVSYYALFVSASGELLLLKVLRGEEIVLADWTPCPQLVTGQPSRLTLELVGNSVRASVNGELVAEAEDGDISGGGYALLAGPGVAARYDELLLRGVRAQ